MMNSTASASSTAAAVQPLLLPFLFDGNNAAGLEIGQRLLPFMEQQGLCSGAPESAAGMVCSFTFGSDDSDVSGAVSETALLQKPLQRISPDSVLGKILFPSSGSSVTPMSTSSKTGSGDLSYSYLGLSINAHYIYGYTYRYHCSVSCRISAAGYGAINGRYLAVQSDTVFAAASAAIYCNFTCSLGGLYAYTQGRDLVKYVLSNGDKRYPGVYTASQAIYAALPSCGIVPGDYQLSPAYQFFANTGITLPYDIGVPIVFGTHHQLLPQGNASSVLNLFPKPTTVATGLLPVTLLLLPTALPVAKYTYQFLSLEAWNFDIIFSAAENTALCAPRATPSAFGSGSVLAKSQGNQFWYWHANAGTDPDYGLPEISILFGFK